MMFKAHVFPQWRLRLQSVRQQIDMRHVAILFVSVLVPLLVIRHLADNIWDGLDGFSWDPFVLQAIHQSASVRRDWFWLNVTRMGSPPLMFCFGFLTTALLGLKHRWREAQFFFIAVVGAGLLNLAAKLVFGRVRPDLWTLLLPKPITAFPAATRWEQWL